MARIGISISATLFVLCCTLPILAQQPSPVTGVTVPPLVRFGGVLTDSDGKPLSGVVGVTFSLYKDSQGGNPLWTETQNVEVNNTGHYSAMLGSAKSTGLPTDVFVSGEARWLGVQVEGREEQPRVLLVSVPYALKAADAETFGGKPVSAFLLAPSTLAVAKSGSELAGTVSTNIAANAITPSIGGIGATGYLARWTNSTTLGSSKLFQSTAGNLGIGTIAPNFPLTVVGGANAIGGVVSGPLSTGVTGQSISTTGTTAGVTGTVASSAGIGVVGRATAGHGSTMGVAGLSDSSMGVGVFGKGNSSGLWGTNSSPGGTGFSGPTAAGVLGTNTASSGCTLSGAALILTNCYGVLGTSGNGGVGVAGQSGTTANTSKTGVGVLGSNTGTGCGSPFVPGCYGVFGIGGAGGVGVGGEAGGALGGTGVFGDGDDIGVEGTSGFGNGVVASGRFGVVTSGFSGLFASASSPNGANDLFDAAGIFDNTGGGLILSGQNNGVVKMTLDATGNLSVMGTITKSGGSFKIDHPLDPANKYLYHSFVESPDMMNIYNGIVVLDAKGGAAINLPEWFQSLNSDFRYQLTSIGAPGPNLYIAQEVSNNSFAIAGGTPGSKVSWQITGIRKDVWANAHRIPVEELKPASARGLYIHPELYGASLDKAIKWEHPPTLTRALERVKERVKARARLPHPGAMRVPGQTATQPTSKQ